MLKFKLKQVLLAQGKKNPQAWLQKFCNINQSKAHNLINNKQKSIAFEDLSKICMVLECSPNDLFWWDNSSKMKVADFHPCITKLSIPSKDSNWTDRIEGLNPERVDALRLFMEQLETEKINEAKTIYQSKNYKPNIEQQNTDEDEN